MPTLRQRTCALPMVLAALLPAAAIDAAPLGSGFTYQGQLKESGQPANGLYDLLVCLYAGPGDPAPLACAPESSDVPVADGSFAISIDFGSAAFIGEERYLELRVRPGASGGAYTVLAPRQLVRAAPEALRSATSSAAPWSGLTGVPAGFADGVDDDTNSGGTVTSVATGTGLTGGPITGSGTVAIAAGGVGSTQIADGGIAATDLGVDSVGSAQIAANAVGAPEIANSAVDTAAIVDANVTTPKLADGAVTAAKVAAGAIGLAQIDSAQVQSRIGGTCVPGTYLRGINANGTVLCEEIPGVSSIATVDNPANILFDATSIAIGTDGRPVISYADTTGGTLKVATCGNPACTSVAAVTTVDDPANLVGRSSSIAIGTDGRPVISYEDSTAHTLLVAKCANAACTGAATITLVDSLTNSIGIDPSIAIGTDGRPVISYRDPALGLLKVAKCANANCTGVATITIVDDPANAVGIDSSIAIGADGLPVISYVDSTARSLNVAKCANAACTGAATITTLDDDIDTAVLETSIAIGADGFPVIAYYDSLQFEIKVAKCANASCACCGTSRVFLNNGTNLMNGSPAIAIGADGLPVISYQDGTADALRLAKCINAACTGASTVTTVDDTGNQVGLSTSIAVGGDGLPVISYLDTTADALKVLKCGSRSCR